MQGALDAEGATVKEVLPWVDVSVTEFQKKQLPRNAPGAIWRAPPSLRESLAGHRRGKDQIG